MNRSIQKANLYFHLKELEKLDVITKVDINRSNTGRGKQYSAYYARTARLFLVDRSTNRDKEELKLLYSDKFINLIQKLNPKTSKEEIIKVVELVKCINRIENKDFLVWLDKYQSLLNELNIDLREFYIFLHFLKIFDSNVFEGISKLSGLLKLD